MKWKWLTGWEDRWSLKRGVESLLLRSPEPYYVVTKIGRLYDVRVVFLKPFVHRITRSFCFNRLMIFYPEKFGLERIIVDGKDAEGRRVQGECDILPLQRLALAGKLLVARLDREKKLDFQVCVPVRFFQGAKE